MNPQNDIDFYYFHSGIYNKQGLLALRRNHPGYLHINCGVCEQISTNT